MGQVLVRNLDDAVIERLKRKAAERGTSLEGVAREALAREAGGDDRAAWVARLDALRATVPEPAPPGSVVADIRAWRDHDRLARMEYRRILEDE